MSQPVSEVEQWLSRQSTSQEPHYFSIIIPAYNEENRLPSTLILCIDYFDSRNLPYEIIIVDDGSRDSTAAMVRKFQKIRKQITLITLPKNRGKGHAVRTGVLSSRGSVVLMADADGSTPFEEVERLERELEQGNPIAFGSRALHSEETSVNAWWYRKVIGRIFNLVVNTLTVPDVRDTQCGFKLFKSEVAQKLFSLQTLDGFAFDVELLYLAHRLGYTFKEVPVNWHSVAGSKVNVITDSFRMFCEVLSLPLRHRHVERKQAEEPDLP